MLVQVLWVDCCIIISFQTPLKSHTIVFSSVPINVQLFVLFFYYKSIVLGPLIALVSSFALLKSLPTACLDSYWFSNINFIQFL